MTRLQLAGVDAALFVLVATLLLGGTVCNDQAPALPALALPAR